MAGKEETVVSPVAYRMAIPASRFLLAKRVERKGKVPHASLVYYTHRTCVIIHRRSI